MTIGARVIEIISHVVTSLLKRPSSRHHLQPCNPDPRLTLALTPLSSRPSDGARRTQPYNTHHLGRCRRRRSGAHTRLHGRLPDARAAGVPGVRLSAPAHKTSLRRSARLLVAPRLGFVGAVFRGEEHLAQALARACRLAGVEEGREAVLGEGNLREGARRHKKSVGLGDEIASATGNALSDDGMSEAPLQESDLVDAVKGRHDAVDDREAAVGQHRRVEARRLDRGGLGGDGGGRDRAVLERPHRLADLGGAKVRGKAGQVRGGGRRSKKAGGRGGAQGGGGAARDASRSPRRSWPA